MLTRNTAIVAITPAPRHSTTAFELLSEDEIDMDLQPSNTTSSPLTSPIRGRETIKTNELTLAFGSSPIKTTRLEFHPRPLFPHAAKARGITRLSELPPLKQTFSSTKERNVR